MKQSKLFQPINQPKVKTITPYDPKNDFVLITGSVSIFGFEFFCGSVVLTNDEGIQIKPCNVLTPDIMLQNELGKSGVKQGDLVHIERKKIKGKKIKNIYHVTPIKVTDEDAKKQLEKEVNDFTPIDLADFDEVVL